MADPRWRTTISEFCLSWKLLIWRGWRGRWLRIYYQMYWIQGCGSKMTDNNFSWKIAYSESFLVKIRMQWCICRDFRVSVSIICEKIRKNAHLIRQNTFHRLPLAVRFSSNKIALSELVKNLRKFSASNSHIGRRHIEFHTDYWFILKMSVNGRIILTRRSHRISMRNHRLKKYTS